MPFEEGSPAVLAIAKEQNSQSDPKAFLQSHAEFN
jgi:hypothetical protein